MFKWTVHYTKIEKGKLTPGKSWINAWTRAGAREKWGKTNNFCYYNWTEWGWL